MQTEDTTLNTEPNDIAGNRVDGPVGNTAARPGAPSTGTGIPGGAPASYAAPAAEARPKPGAAGANEQADASAALQPNGPMSEGAYGGNFSNSTQGSYRDQDRRENQDSAPSRGEFGVQDLGGTTHGGFGNQNRLADYEPSNSAEDAYYGGPGSAGPQDNAYRAYDGRDERPDARTQYGFEAGAPIANTSGQAADAAPSGPGQPSGPRTDNTNQPGRADALSAHQNDNGSPIGPDRGFAADYGQTSLQGAAASADSADSVEGSPRRNQDEDGQSSRGGYDNQGKAGGPAGHQQEPAPGSEGASQAAEPHDQRSASSLGDRGRDEPQRAPDDQTGSDRSGYVSANSGDVAQGIGSRGGSYNDAYDDSKPGSKVGSPAKGDQRREDLDRNYGLDAREENRASDAENAADHGAPRRNTGREGEGDE